MNKLLSLTTLAMVILLSSCSKKITPTITGEPKDILAIEEIDFEYFHGKAKLIIKDANKEREVKANIRVRKDSVIWMDLSVVGVSGARALINQDSITIRSNVAKEYYVFSFEELSKKFNIEVNYELIQAAVLGNLLMPRKPEDNVEQKSATFLLKQNSGSIDILNYISALTMKIQKVELRESDTHNSLTINYGNFQQVANKMFPYNATISILYKSPNGLLNTSVIFEYNKAEVGDKELKFPFNIPKKYERK